MPKLSFLTIISLIILHAQAQDTLRITHPISIATLDTSIDHTSHQIVGKALLLPFTPYNSPFKYLKLTDSKPVIFTHTFFYLNGHLGLPKTSETLVRNNLEFDICNLKYLNLAELSGSILIYDSKIGVLYIDSTYSSQLQLNTADIRNVAMILNGVNLTVDCQNTLFADTAYILMIHSVLTDFRFGPTAKSGSEFRFWNDTLKKTFLTYGFATEAGKLVQSSHNIFRFQDCYIDANFFFFDEIPNSIFYFEGCTFGPNADLSDFPAQKVMFRSCRFLGIDRYIGVHSKTDTTFLSFINTNLDNIRFDFTSKMRLWFDSTDNSDVIESTYAHLLKKFKDEGENSTAKIIDIQHQELIGNKFFNNVDRIWWNYGYNKVNGLYWMIGFMIFFLALNITFCRQISETYPILPLNVPKYRRYRILRRFVLISLFTIFVFFSLRIDFSKLKYDRLGFVLILLIEYAVGVWCLFFIARTLLAF